MADKKKEDQVLQDIFEDKRTFIHDGEKYYIDSADIEQVKQADWQYSRTFNEALLAGVATAAQMEDILSERNIVGKDFDAKRKLLITELDSKVAELQESTDPVVKAGLADEVEEIRNRLFRHNQRASSPMSNSCEQLSEDSRIEYLTSVTVKDSNGAAVWESYEDFKTNRDKAPLAMRARYECMLAMQGLESDFLDKTPEALARKELLALEESKSEEQHTEEQPTEEQSSEETETRKPRKTKK